MTDLTFNEEDHTYWWKLTQQLLSITAVLKLANVLDAYVYGTNEVPLTRGSFVHEATAFVDGTFVPPGQKRKRITVLDIKTTSTGAMADWHAIQLAGYWHLLTKHLTITGRMQYEKALKIERWALYLAKDGSYKLKQFTDMKDLAVFNAAVTIAGWRHANGKGNA